MLKFWRSLFAPPPRRQPVRRRLRLEGLEGRAVPAGMIFSQLLPYAPTKAPFTDTQTPTPTGPNTQAPTPTGPDILAPCTP